MAEAQPLLQAQLTMHNTLEGGLHKLQNKKGVRRVEAGTVAFDDVNVVEPPEHADLPRQVLQRAVCRRRAHTCVPGYLALAAKLWLVHAYTQGPCSCAVQCVHARACSTAAGIYASTGTGDTGGIRQLEHPLLWWPHALHCMPHDALHWWRAKAQAVQMSISTACPEPPLTKDAPSVHSLAHTCMPTAGYLLHALSAALGLALAEQRLLVPVDELERDRHAARLLRAASASGRPRVQGCAHDHASSSCSHRRGGANPFQHWQRRLRLKDAQAVT